MQHFGFLFAAYTVVWIGIFLYVRSLAQRNRELERDIEDLRQLVGKQRHDVSSNDEPR